MRKALDLFCKAGGATKGLQRAGFHVTGVDIEPQPRYCGDLFVQADALTFPLDDFDFIWASPPCQKYTTLANLHPDNEYPDLIAAVRLRLQEWGGKYVIENVPGAPLRQPALLCGSMFGLKVRRHRLFETNWYFSRALLLCQHRKQGRPIDVSGTGARRTTCKRGPGGGDSYKPRNLAEARAAIGIDWMNRMEISQAIPPPYAEYIARSFVELSI